MAEWLRRRSAKLIFVGSNPIFFNFMFFNSIIDISYLHVILQCLLVVLLLLISIAYFTLLERKIMGSVHRRVGPNVVGVYGLLQPLSDGLKLFLKETVVPSTSNKVIYLVSPVITFTISLMAWAVIPYDNFAVLADLNIGALYIFAVSSLGVYGVVLSGWSSNSKYAFLGGLRSTAQMISYEVSIGFILIVIIVCTGSFNLTDIIQSQSNLWFVITFFPLFLLFFISALAETNRYPFDLPEAEAELVSGYNVEYGAVGFALFFLGEYGNMLVMSSLTSVLFFGGWLAPCWLLSFLPGSFWFSVKVCFFAGTYVWVRTVLPRFRYDQLMALGWKSFLPASLAYLIIVFSSVVSFNLLPF